MSLNPTKPEQRVLYKIDAGHHVTWDGYTYRWRQEGRAVTKPVRQLIERGFLYTFFPRGGGYAELDKPAKEWLERNPPQEDWS